MRMKNTSDYLSVLILFTFFLFFSTSVNAATINVQQVSPSTGIDIIYPSYGVIKQNQDFHFHFNTFNMSNGVLLTNATVDCEFHLMNQSSTHILMRNLTYDSPNNHWDLDIKGGNFSKIGRYSYLVWCNNTVKGGAVSVGFEVTTDGTADTIELDKISDKKQYYLIIFVLIICIILIIGGFMLQDSAFVFIGGMLMSITGGYIALNGFGNTQNKLVDALFVILAVVGAYISLRTAMEEAQNAMDN